MRSSAQIVGMSERRFGAHLARVGAFSERVGYDMSAGAVQDKLTSLVANNSTLHDASVASWHEVWNTRGNSGRVDSNGDRIMTKLDLFNFCKDAGVNLPPGMGGCNKVVDGLLEKFDGADGSPKNNQITWAEFLAGSGWVSDVPTGPAPPPPPVADPEVISDADRNSAALTDAQIEAMCAPLYTFPGAVDGCRVTAQGQRADAQAKIARITAAADAAAKAKGGKWAGFVRAPFQNALVDQPIAPKKPAGIASTAAAIGAVPVGIGGLVALKVGWTALAVGGVVGVIAAGGIYAYLRMSQPKVTG